MTPDVLEAQRDGNASHRTTGVWDDSAVDPVTPVATVSSWPTELTVPGHRSVTGWAISAVSVAPTHRRQGVARALLEAELRTARSLNVPVAILTVSEATIYGRYGFAPAARAAEISVDTSRTKWAGPVASGRVQFVTAEQLEPDGRRLLEEVRLTIPGHIEFPEYRWKRLLGLHVTEDDASKDVRFVRYDDAVGQPQGFAVYRITETERGENQQVLTVLHLVAATDDAYAGLWRYLTEMDLVCEVKAPLRSVDEALAWQLSNGRALRKTTEQDHLWIRILENERALEARRYFAPGRIVLEVDDALGFAAGRTLLEIAADGSASATAFDGAIPDDAAAIALGVNELAALYLGGVSATTLARAGRITELTDGAAVAVDGAFRSDPAPWLSIWF